MVQLSESRGRLALSILLATRNRASLLESTLAHFGGLELGGIDWELIVADNGSTDKTADVLERAGKRLPLLALHEPAPGKNRAINRALAAARGELLMFTDDDVEPDAGWVQEYLAAAARWPGHSVFGGPVIPRFPPGTPSWLGEHPQLAGPAFARYSPDQAEGPCPQLPFGVNFAIRARRLQGLRFAEEMGPQGLDNGIMGGETELLRRLRDAGEQCIFVPRTRVRHVIQSHQLEPDWLLRRMFRMGRTKTKLQPHREAVRVLGAPRFLWRHLIKAALRHMIARIRGGRARLETGLALYRLRGELYEYRSARHPGLITRLLQP